MADPGSNRTGGPDAEAGAAPAGSLGNGAPAWLDESTMARYTDSSSLPPHAMVGLDREQALPLDAHFIGCTPERLREIRAEHARLLEQTATTMLAEPGFAAEIEAIPSVTGDRVVVLGDSITADALSWANLLGACLSAAPATAYVVVRNLAVSGFTSGEVVSSFDLVVRERPSCVIAMLGTNDGRIHGRHAAVTAVGADETRRNLVAVQRLTQCETDARFIPVAPPPMSQDRYDMATPSDATTRFSSANLDRTLAIVREVFPDVIDVPALLDHGSDDDFWLPDGLHPTLAGQQTILRHVVTALAHLGPAPAATA